MQWTLGAGAGGGVWDRAARWRQRDRQAAGEGSFAGQQLPALQTRDAGCISTTARPVHKQAPSSNKVVPHPSQPVATRGGQVITHEISSSQGISKQTDGTMPQTKRMPNFSRLHAAWSSRLASAKAAVQQGLTVVQVSALCIPSASVATHLAADARLLMCAAFPPVQEAASSTATIGCRF